MAREGALAASGLCPDPYTGRGGVFGLGLAWAAGAWATGGRERMGKV